MLRSCTSAVTVLISEQIKARAVSCHPPLSLPIPPLLHSFTPPPFISPSLHLSIPLPLHSFTPPPLPQLPPQPVQSRPQHTAKHPVHSLDDCQQRHFPYCGDDGDTKCRGEGTCVCVCVCGCEGEIVRGNSLTVAGIPGNHGNP